HLLYLGSGGGLDFDHPGRLLVLDESGAGRLVDWSRPFRPQGLSGLAFDGDGTLWATTLPERGGEQLLAKTTAVTTAIKRSRALATVPRGTSALLRLDPDTGAIQATLGPFTDASGF